MLYVLSGDTLFLSLFSIVIKDKNNNGEVSLCCRFLFFLMGDDICMGKVFFKIALSKIIMIAINN